MANDFKIILQSVLDTSQIQKQLQDLQKNTTIKINSSSSGSPLKPMLDDVQKLGKLQIQAYEEDARRTAQKQADIQKLGKMQIEAANMEIQAQEKLNAAFAKYQQEVDTFIAKTQNRDLSKPGAQGALDVRNQMQGAINSGDIEKVRELSAVAKVADANFQGLSNSGKTFTQQLGDAAKQVGLTVIAMQAMQLALQDIKDGFNYIKDLDKELTNIRLVTGQSKESVYELGKEYNQTAKEMGVTTLEIAKSSVEFIRQGKTVTETAQLIRNSTMLSKLGNLDAADAADKLTSIMNGFKLSAEETGTVLDKLVKNCQNIWQHMEKLLLTDFNISVILNFSVDDYID